MNIIIKNNYDEICTEAAEIIREAWKRKNNLVLGLATGRTPLGLYEKLIALHKKGEIDFNGVSTFNLDEYLGLDETHPQSFANYMDRHLFRHVNIRRQNIFHLSGTPTDIEEQCSAYERKIRSCGGIDLQILGIGLNGHIGFNEPGSSLSSRTRLLTLTKETIEANASFFHDMAEGPRFCLTMGIGTILEAKTILLLASGKDKAQVVAGAIEGPITASLPASALQLHPRSRIIIDEEAASMLTHADYYRWAYESRDKVSLFLKK